MDVDPGKMGPIHLNLVVLDSTDSSHFDLGPMVLGHVPVGPMDLGPIYLDTIDRDPVHLILF